MTTVLVVDDDPGMCTMLQARLSTRGFTVLTRPSGSEAISVAQREPIDVVVTDVNMKGLSGVELCQQLLEFRPHLPVVLITAFGSMEMAIQAIRAGAYDFLPKPFDIEHLVLAIDRGATLSRLRDEVERLRKMVTPTTFGSLVGSSAVMSELYTKLGKIADNDAGVLLTGESGTGKELVARAVHSASARAQGPFVAVNCAAMPAQLLESELFGHARGAFTDARTAKVGLFQSAEGGTIFLDEIGELPIEIQPKLLRVLQERAVRPVGSNTEIKVDARVICATNRELEDMVEQQRFREDLFFRVNVLAVRLPPLRARGGDIVVLARHFLERIGARTGKRIPGLSAEAAHKLMIYPWPGNVRELENCMEFAVALAAFSDITVADLPDKIRTYKPTQIVLSSNDPEQLVSLEELERRYTVRVLESLDGNKAAAARVLGIERRTLYRMLERWGEPLGDRRS
jgi:two-component system response regulator HydG